MVREANVKQATAEKQLKEAQGKVSLGAFLMDGETSHECPDALGGCCYWRSSTYVILGSCRTTSEHKAHTAPVTLDAGVYSTTASLLPAAYTQRMLQSSWKVTFVFLVHWEKSHLSKLDYLRSKLKVMVN